MIALPGYSLPVHGLPTYGLPWYEEAMPATQSGSVNYIQVIGGSVQSFGYLPRLRFQRDLRQ